MYRKPLFELLENYEPVFLEEKLYKRNMLDFLRANEDCFERSLRIGHFTGSAWIIDYDNSNFLLTHHKKLGIWVQLGGHADGCSNIVKVAEKEAFEESGLESLKLVSSEIFDIDVHKIPKYKDIPEHFHYDVRFLLKVSDKNDFIKISNESLDLKWFDKAPPYASSSIIRMFEKWKKFG